MKRSLANDQAVTQCERTLKDDLKRRFEGGIRQLEDRVAQYFEFSLQWLENEVARHRAAVEGFGWDSADALGDMESLRTKIAHILNRKRDAHLRYELGTRFREEFEEQAERDLILRSTLRQRALALPRQLQRQVQVLGEPSVRLEPPPQAQRRGCGGAVARRNSSRSPYDSCCVLMDSLLDGKVPHTDAWSVRIAKLTHWVALAHAWTTT